MGSTSTEQQPSNTGTGVLATTTILTDIDSYGNVSMFADIREARHVPSAARPERLRPRRRRRVLLEALRVGAGQTPPRLRQLRGGRPPAQAHPHRGPWPAREPQPPRRGSGVH